MSDAAARLKARRNAATQEKEAKVFGGRDPFLNGGLSDVSPNRYLVRIIEGNIFETKAKDLSSKISCEIVAVLANGYDPAHKFDEKARYGEPNPAGERVCLIAGQKLADEMTLKNVKEMVAAIRGIDGRKLSGLASSFIVYDKETCDLVLTAKANGDTSELSAFPALSYATLFAAEGELPDPATASEDDVQAAAIEAGILPKKASLNERAEFLSQVGDLCQILPTGLEYGERWANSFMVVETAVRPNKERTKYYSNNTYRPASEALLKAHLTPEAFKAYQAYRQING